MTVRQLMLRLSKNPSEGIICMTLDGRMEIFKVIAGRKSVLDYIDIPRSDAP